MMTQKIIKRIPVSNARWKQLGKMKKSGQTYDGLLAEMVVSYNKDKLAESAKNAKEKKGSWHKLEDM